MSISKEEEVALYFKARREAMNNKMTPKEIMEEIRSRQIPQEEIDKAVRENAVKMIRLLMNEYNITFQEIEGS